MNYIIIIIIIIILYYYYLVRFEIRSVGEFSLVCCTSMAHAGNTEIWAKIISAYAKKCSITGFSSLGGGGREAGA